MLLREPRTRVNSAVSCETTDPNLRIRIAILRISPLKRPGFGELLSQPQLTENCRSANIGLLIRHQPARTVSTRVSRFVRLPVCEQCAGKVERNSVGTRSGRSPPVLPLPDRVRSLGVRIERRSRIQNAVQRRTCATFWKQWHKSVTTDSDKHQRPGT